MKLRVIRGSAFTAACALFALVVACKPSEQRSQTFKIEFPDASFVVPESWIPARVWGSHGRFNFIVDVPLSHLPPALTVEERALPGARLSTAAVHLQFGYLPNPERRSKVDLVDAGWRSYRQIAGFAEYTHSTIRGDGITEHLLVWEADDRIWARCLESPAEKVVRGCGMVVPYKTFTDGKSTQITFSLSYAAIEAWEQQANRRRQILRMLEVQ
ncbi:hypothetical protein ACQ86G_30210 [Roseateles chitinivorans]|uniref:hypothetical protein n=1 Tax=Roseateles chitinivorans TaxID=2917965 RepID=UPI003D66E6A9